MRTLPDTVDGARRWTDTIGEVKVLIVVDGYVVARRPGAVPFVVHERKFRQAFKRGE